MAAPVRRNEDPRLLRGMGSFVDDIDPPGVLHAAILRSPHGHARIGSIDASAARAHPGVRAVYVAADLGDFNQPAQSRISNFGTWWRRRRKGGACPPLLGPFFQRLGVSG